MRIRNEQIQALDETGHPEFENGMVAHLREFAPLHWQALAEDGMRRLVREGLARASNHGLTKRGPVRFYLETTILLGIDFDTDPQYPWAGRILRDPTMPDQVERADQVYTELMVFLDLTGGPNGEYAVQALRRMREMPFEALPVKSEGFEDEAIRRMNQVHPEKCDYLGEARLRALIPRAAEEAQRLRVATDAGICLLLALMFVIGHGCAADPKFPWIARALGEDATTLPDQRVERLYSKAMIYLDQVLMHVGGQ